MASTPEKLVKDKIKKILKAHGAWYAMPMGTGYGNSGVPDFLVCLDGGFLAIEAKAGKGIPTALQEKNLRDIEKAGGRTLIVNETILELGTLEAVLENMK
jgi:hypothetical protein